MRAFSDCFYVTFTRSYIFNAILLEFWPKWRVQFSNNLQFIQFVQKSKTCKWWNEFMNQFYTWQNNKHDPNSNFIFLRQFIVHHSHDVDISFVKLFGYFFVFQMICSSRAYSWELFRKVFVGFCLLIYSSNEHGYVFPGNDLHFFFPNLCFFCVCVC